MKAFVVSDVHGFYDELMTSLNKEGFDINNPEHIFISCGDLLDRGPDAIKCLEFVNNLPKERKILILGNHEDLMEEAICRRYFASHDIHNMTHDSVYQLVGKGDDSDRFENDYAVLEAMKENELWNTYIKSCIDFYETENEIFVHGWIPCFDKWGCTYYNRDNWRTGDWIEARWVNGMEAWSRHITVPNKTIYCGHWHTSWGHSYLHNDGKEWLSRIETYYIDEKTGKQEPHCNFGIFEDEGICALDACTAVNHVVNCKVIDNFKLGDYNEN